MDLLDFDAEDMYFDQPLGEEAEGLIRAAAEQYGQPSTNGIELTIKLSHQDLASIIGSTRETVTVILGELQSEGSVQLGRRRIVLRDLERLADSVNRTVPQNDGSSMEVARVASESSQVVGDS